MIHNYGRRGMLTIFNSWDAMDGYVVYNYLDREILMILNLPGMDG